MSSRFTVTTGASASVNNVAPASATAKFALSANAAASLILLTPGTTGPDLLIIEIEVGFDGSTATAPVEVMLYRVRTAGTPAGVTGNINKLDPGTQAALATALTNLTTETSNIDVLNSWPVAANNGLLIKQYPLGREPIGPGSGARIGILARAASRIGFTFNDGRPNFFSSKRYRLLQC